MPAGDQWVEADQEMIILGIDSVLRPQTLAKLNHPLAEVLDWLVWVLVLV
jgi:hypothetical protein